MSSPVEPDVAIEPIPAFRDNYIWLLTRGDRAAVVDPGIADPVRALLAARGLTLEAILVTHHHADHTGGVAALAAETSAAIMGPAGEDISTGGGRLQRLREGDAVCVLGCTLSVLDVPGHTAGHIAFHAPELQAVFCGDTLFAAGCGRLFEGTPAQMLDSLTRLARLPDSTRVYCAHEYTMANLRFAREVEPDNARLAQRQQACAQQREQGWPTVPSTLDEERATNPFLRVDEPAVRAAADRRQPGAGRSAVDTFAALRAWKNAFA
ncbi:MAG: hydroxyacylglutathione hydrolase [Burkholderiaceae bacterium]|jgi:hydroxyacylglutathione hydrolase|nr:hydroxyacylglutathione hydrolase [Burkholderiaceae bacterium]